jgi:hypothetical protein
MRYRKSQEIRALIAPFCLWVTWCKWQILGWPEKTVVCKVIHFRSILFNIAASRSWAGIAIRPRAGRPRGVGVRFPTGARQMSLLHNVQAGSGAHPTSYTTGTGSCFPGVKRQGHEADHSHSSNSEVKNGGGTPTLLHTSSWRGVH